MEVKASLKGDRVSASKARLVADLVRGKGIEEALNILSLSHKKSAQPISKLLRSAVANAEFKNEEQNAGIDVDSLVVKTIYVNEANSTSVQARNTSMWLPTHLLRVWTDRDREQWWANLLARDWSQGDYAELNTMHLYCVQFN